MPLTLNPTVLNTLRSAASSLLGRALPAARAALPASRGAIASVGRAAAGAGRVLAPAVAGGVAYAGAERLMNGGGYYRPRRRRAKGITAAELRGARKVAALVRMYGMKPKSGKIRGRRR